MNTDFQNRLNLIGTLMPPPAQDCLDCNREGKVNGETCDECLGTGQITYTYDGDADADIQWLYDQVHYQAKLFKEHKDTCRDAFVSIANGLAAALDSEDQEQVYQVWVNIVTALQEGNRDLGVVLPRSRVKGCTPAFGCHTFHKTGTCSHNEPQEGGEEK